MGSIPQVPRAELNLQFLVVPADFKDEAFHLPRELGAASALGRFTHSGKKVSVTSLGSLTGDDLGRPHGSQGITNSTAESLLIFPRSCFYW